MARDVVLVVAGAVLGWFFTVAPEVITRLRGSIALREARVRQSLTQAGVIDRWLLDYYDRTAPNSIFRANIGDCSVNIPVLTKGEWLFAKDLNPGSDWPVALREARRHPFPVSRRLIKRRQRMGAKLFRTWRDSLYMDELASGTDPILYARPCQFFQIATALIKLESET